LLPFGFFFAFWLPKIEESGSKKARSAKKGTGKRLPQKMKKKAGEKYEQNARKKKECEMW
jgi:hypothetical protein